MMALIANPTQAFTMYTRVTLKTCACCHSVGRDGCSLLQQRCLASVRWWPVILQTGKSFKVSSFKGSPQNDDSVGKSNGIKCTKKSVKLSYAPQESDETVNRSSDIHNLPLSYESEDGDNGLAGSPVIQNLFEKWLMILRTQPSSQASEIVPGPPRCENIPETHSGSLRLKARNVLSDLLGFFFRLDMAIRTPLLLFIPLYLAVNLVYGAEVSRELTPMWIIGPPILAIHIRMVQGIYALYISSFKLLVKNITYLPTYYKLVSSYVAEGKLKAFLCQPLVDIKNFDYEGNLRPKLKQLQEWVVEKYLDYVESIWPYYCKTIRFLKKANLI